MKPEPEISFQDEEEGILFPEEENEDELYFSTDTEDGDLIADQEEESYFALFY